MAMPLPRRPRLHSVLELRSLIEHAQDDLARARHELNEAERRLRALRVYLETVGASFQTIVELYNRVAVEYDGTPRRAR